MPTFIMIILAFISGLIIGLLILFIRKKENDNKISLLQANIDNQQDKLNALQKDIEKYRTLEQEKRDLEHANIELATTQRNLKEQNQQKLRDLEVWENKAEDYRKAYEKINTRNEILEEKIQRHKQEVTALQKQFETNFENLTNKIFEKKSADFTHKNKESLKHLLIPLDKNLTEFKKRVNEVYDKEAKERFSLSERVKELAELNKTISEEAHHLTTALKGEAKTQGQWGEMILENLLERSGLKKDREYFLEYQLEDEEGNPLHSVTTTKKMRPDAVVKYPGNRSIIIDAKVSLNAFTRFIAATEDTLRKKELADHISAIKHQITTLSRKGYDDYASSLDFVMMFIPSEPAYMAAIQTDADLWNFAYDKRILLVSPSNLITALKLVVDLWKREYQNQNTRKIAEQGGKLYDKFVSFAESMEDIGKHIQKADDSYQKAKKQLSSGRNNLQRQAQKLKDLGVKSKKEIPKSNE